MGCGERMQTFSNLELTVALTIVAKASGIGAQGQERCGSGFHTRHGCALVKFRGVPTRGFRRARFQALKRGAPNPFETMALEGRAASESFYEGSESSSGDWSALRPGRLAGRPAWRTL